MLGSRRSPPPTIVSWSAPKPRCRQRAALPHPVQFDRRGLLHHRILRRPPRSPQRLRPYRSQPGLCAARRYPQRGRAEAARDGARRGRRLGRALRRRAAHRRADPLRARARRHRPPSRSRRVPDRAAPAGARSPCCSRTSPRASVPRRPFSISTRRWKRASPRRSPSASTPKKPCASRRRWKPSASSPAASRTTSTIS